MEMVLLFNVGAVRLSVIESILTLVQGDPWSRPLCGIVDGFTTGVVG